jgi:hypothetical protein
MTAEDTRTWLEGWIEIPGNWHVGASHIEMTLGDTEIRITLTATHIASLRNHTFPNIRGLSRVPDCGIETTGYAEYLLSFDGWGSWPADAPLRFKVGDVFVRIGRISPALALFCEEIYRSSDYMQKGFFESYSSLQIEGSTKPRDDASVALFYLNADYLRPLKSSARIQHLVDPSGPDPFPVTGKPSDILRRRVRVRKRIDALPAIALFNAAATEWGEARFLGFYRVLEFFFHRGALRDFGRMRRDPNISDETLLASSRLEKELPQLKALLRSALTAAESHNFVEFVGRHHLGIPKSIDEVSVALYGYRNTIVHAKESEIDRAVIPLPFATSSSAASWSWVVETIAERAIRRLT